MRMQVQRDFHKILGEARASPNPKLTLQNAIQRLLDTHKADLRRSQKICTFEEANKPRCSLRAMPGESYCQTHAVVVENIIEEFKECELSNVRNTDKVFHLAKDLIVTAFEECRDTRQRVLKANINNVEEVYAVSYAELERYWGLLSREANRLDESPYFEVKVKPIHSICLKRVHKIHYAKQILKLSFPNISKKKIF